MRIELGAPVVISETSDELYHVAAELDPRHTLARGRWARTLLDRLEAGQIPPLDWVAACGLRGPLFVYGGPLRSRRCCRVCIEASPEKIRAPAADPLVRRIRREFKAATLAA